VSHLRTGDLARLRSPRRPGDGGVPEGGPLRGPPGRTAPWTARLALPPL